MIWECVLTAVLLVLVILMVLALNRAMYEPFNPSRIMKEDIWRVYRHTQRKVLRHKVRGRKVIITNFPTSLAVCTTKYIQRPDGILKTKSCDANLAVYNIKKDLAKTNTPFAKAVKSMSNKKAKKEFNQILSAIQRYLKSLTGNADANTLMRSPAHISNSTLAGIRAKMLFR